MESSNVNLKSSCSIIAVIRMWVFFGALTLLWKFFSFDLESLPLMMFSRISWRSLHKTLLYKIVKDIIMWNYLFSFYNTSAQRSRLYFRNMLICSDVRDKHIRELFSLPLVLNMPKCVRTWELMEKKLFTFTLFYFMRIFPRLPLKLRRKIFF